MKQLHHCMGMGVWCSTAWAPLPQSTTNTGAQIALRSKLELRATPPPTACSQHDQIWAYSTVKPYRDSSYNKHSSQTDSKRYIALAGHEGGPVPWTGGGTAACGGNR